MLVDVRPASFDAFESGDTLISFSDMTASRQSSNSSFHQANHDP